MSKKLRADLLRFYNVPNPSILHIVYFLFVNRGFREIGMYRFSNWAYTNKRYIILRLIEIYKSYNSIIEISSYAEIDQGMLIPHPQGIVIGNGTKIGKNTTILQNVTIGISFIPVKYCKKINEQTYPIVGDNVVIGAGAVLIGPIKIGSNTIIGSNAVVTHDVPPGSIVAGNPANIIGTIEEKYPEYWKTIIKTN